MTKAGIQWRMGKAGRGETRKREKVFKAARGRRRVPRLRVYSRAAVFSRPVAGRGRGYRVQCPPPWLACFCSALRLRSGGSSAGRLAGNKLPYGGAALLLRTVSFRAGEPCASRAVDRAHLASAYAIELVKC